MKQVFAVFVLLLMAPVVLAQGEWYERAFPDSAFSRWTVSVLAGVDKNYHDVDMMYAADMRYLGLSGMSAGVSVQYHITGWAAVRADASWLQKNYMMYRMGYKVNDVHTETTNDYLSLPVVAQFSLGGNFRAYGFFGGFVGYWLKSHRSGYTLTMNNIIYGDTEGGAFDEDVVFNEVKDNRFDAGLVYGAGLACTLWNRLDLSFEARSFYSLTDMQKPYMEFLNPTYNTTVVFQLGVGVWL